MILDMSSDIKTVNLIWPQSEETGTYTGAATDVSGYIGWAQVNLQVHGYTAVTGTCIVALQGSTFAPNSPTGITAGSTAAFAYSVSLYTGVASAGTPTYAFDTVTETAATPDASTAQTKFIYLDGTVKYIRGVAVGAGASDEFGYACQMLMTPKVKPIS